MKSLVFANIMMRVPKNNAGRVKNKDNVDWKRANLSRFLLLKSWYDTCII